MNQKIFFSEYFKHPLELGTFTQSSRYLVRGIRNELIGKNIIELGAGTGPITKGILDYLSEDGSLLSFENNEKLFDNLRSIKDSRFTPINDSAENLETYISKTIDCIVSGLPLTSIKKSKRDKVLSVCSRYPRFIQYKYFNSKEILGKYFNNIRTIRIFRNFPPAYVYVCKNIKHK